MPKNIVQLYQIFLSEPWFSLERNKKKMSWMYSAHRSSSFMYPVILDKIEYLKSFRQAVQLFLELLVHSIRRL